MALRWLGRREYGRHELASKLTQKGVPHDVAEAAVERLADANLVSDQRFAEVFARQRVERLQGARRIRAELQARGIGAADIEEALQPFDGGWGRRAREWARRRHRGELDRRERARLYRAGRQRGFSHDQVMAAIDHLHSGAEDD